MGFDQEGFTVGEGNADEEETGGFAHGIDAGAAGEAVAGAPALPVVVGPGTAGEGVAGATAASVDVVEDGAEVCSSVVPRLPRAT